MAHQRPYLFCRYLLLSGERTLDTRRQLSALQELQGQFFAHGPTAEREGRRDLVLMRPRMLLVGRERALVWSVGQRIDTRVGVKYDQDADRIEFVAIDDGTVRYNDFVSIPRLGVVAIDDRTGGLHIGAKGVIARFRSLFRNIEDGAADVVMTTTSADMNHALNNWDLREVSFKVRPFNPHPRDELSRQLSEAMRREGIGTLRAVARPAVGGTMRPNQGPLDQAHSLTEDGYGQMGVRGVMPDGHVAYIPRPNFEEERARNQSIQAKPRELRVYVETEGDTDDESFENAARALVGFYDR